MKRRSTRHLLRKMLGLSRRYTDTTPPDRTDRLARLGGSYLRQWQNAVPRIARLYIPAIERRE